jgi:hypothetical protein
MHIKTTLYLLELYCGARTLHNVNVNVLYTEHW